MRQHLIGLSDPDTRPGMEWALASSPQLRLQEARIKLVDNAPGLEGALEDIVNRQDESPQRTSTHLGASSADRVIARKP